MATDPSPARGNFPKNPFLFWPWESMPTLSGPIWDPVLQQIGRRPFCMALSDDLALAWLFSPWLAGEHHNKHIYDVNN